MRLLPKTKRFAEMTSRMRTQRIVYHGVATDHLDRHKTTLMLIQDCA